MIYTVTLNPAVDLVMRTDKFSSGEVNRSREENIFFGGKGINVSFILRELGAASAALGFTAGFTGEAIENGVRERGVKADFVRLKSGFSRINVKIKAGEETELNGSGPDIPESAVNELFKKLEKLSDGDTLVLAGSVPRSLPKNIYELMLDRIKDKNIRIAADAEKELLLNVLKYRPFVVKPNRHELGDMFGVKLSGIDEISEYAGRLREMGARNVLVSMAGDGALLLDENGGLHVCAACKGSVKNSVGAGDSMLAGFIFGADPDADGNVDYEYALKLGTAAGGATAFSEGLAVKEDILKLFGTI